MSVFFAHPVVASMLTSPSCFVDLGLSSKCGEWIDCMKFSSFKINHLFISVKQNGNKLVIFQADIKTKKLAVESSGGIWKDIYKILFFVVF